MVVIRHRRSDFSSAALDILSRRSNWSHYKRTFPCAVSDGLIGLEQYMLAHPRRGDIQRALHERDARCAFFDSNREDRALHDRHQIWGLDRHGPTMSGLNVVERGAGALKVAIDEASRRAGVRKRDGRIGPDMNQRIVVLEI